MTKRFFTILTMMVLCISTLSAQSIMGKWYSDEVAEALEINDMGDVALNIKEKTISIDIYITIEDDGAKIKMVYSIPGTYTKTGKKVTAKFNEDNADVKVTDFKTNDPELLAEMKTQKGKKDMYDALGLYIQTELSDFLEGLTSVTSVFSEFTVKRVTDKTLFIDIFGDSGDAITIPLKRNRTESNRVIKNKQIKLLKNYK